MRPVARGIAGGLLLSLVIVTGVRLLSGVSTSAGSNLIVGQPVYEVSTRTTFTATSSTTIAAATTAAPSVLGDLNAAQSAANATVSSVQTKSSYSVLLTFLPIAAALALGASAYLISRSRIEKET